jgi:hypothetical protein
MSEINNSNANFIDAPTALRRQPPSNGSPFKRFVLAAGVLTLLGGMGAGGAYGLITSKDNEQAQTNQADAAKKKVSVTLPGGGSAQVELMDSSSEIPVLNMVADKCVFEANNAAGGTYEFGPNQQKFANADDALKAFATKMGRDCLFAATWITVEKQGLNFTREDAMKLARDFDADHKLWLKEVNAFFERNPNVDLLDMSEIAYYSFGMIPKPDGQMPEITLLSQQQDMGQVLRFQTEKGEDWVGNMARVWCDWQPGMAEKPSVPAVTPPVAPPPPPVTTTIVPPPPETTIITTTNVCIKITCYPTPECPPGTIGEYPECYTIPPTTTPPPVYECPPEAPNGGWKNGVWVCKDNPSDDPATAIPTWVPFDPIPTPDPILEEPDVPDVPAPTITTHETPAPPPVTVAPTITQSETPRTTVTQTVEPEMPTTPEEDVCIPAPGETTC